MVLAVRTLFVNEENTLAVALDELLSLARQTGVEHSSTVAPGLRLRSIFEKDPRWNASLGPHRLIYQKMDPKEAFELMPTDLWFETLASVIRLFPGLGPDSICRDLGDAPALALESVFNQPINELEKLLLRSRSLIVIDWKFNRDIHSIIKTFLDQI